MTGATSKEVTKPIKMDKKIHVVHNYFPNKRDGVVVECGTAEGHHQPSIHLEQELGWKFVGFEPDPRYFPTLSKNRPDALKLPLALSDEDGLGEFEISAWGGNSSLEHSKDHRNELIGYNKTFEDGSYFKTVHVPTLTWDTFIRQYKIGHVDFFILDVEGSEMKVLEGMRDPSLWPDVMQVEFGYSDHNNSIINEAAKENFSGFKIIKDKLESMGYGFDYLNDNNLMFSKRNFWEERTPPAEWFGEDLQFSWNGYLMYDKEKCSKL